MGPQEQPLPIEKLPSCERLQGEEERPMSKAFSLLPRGRGSFPPPTTRGRCWCEEPRGFLEAESLDSPSLNLQPPLPLHPAVLRSPPRETRNPVALGMSGFTCRKAVRPSRSSRGGALACGLCTSDRNPALCELSYGSQLTVGSKPCKERKLCGQRSDSGHDSTSCPARGLV